MLARVVVYARFHYLLEVNAAEDSLMHGSLNWQDASTEDASWTNQLKRELGRS